MDDTNSFVSSRVKLERVLAPKRPARQLVIDLMRSFTAPMNVLGMDDQMLLGELEPSSPGYDELPRHPVLVEGTLRGWVIGTVGAPLIADLLSHLLTDALHQHSLGSELLDNYREVNLLYSLAESFAGSLEVGPIAQVALQEAGGLVREAEGAVLLWDPESDCLQPCSTIGEAFAGFAGGRPGEGAIGRIFELGKGEVINDLTPEELPGLAPDAIASMVCAPLRGKTEILGVLVIASRNPQGFAAADLKRLNIVAAQAGPAIENSILYEKQVELTASYSRFVPPELLRFLGKDSITEVDLGDYVRREMAIMVSDIHGFTSLSEKMTPQENFQFINRFLAGISPIIRQHGGFIVKYMGDGIMALFPGGVEDAVRAALEKIEHVRAQAAEFQTEVGEEVRLGVGLNIGTMMVGTIGEQARMQGDVFSDAVNLTARLEGLTREYGADIVISEQALAAIEHLDRYEHRYLGEARVKGRQEPIRTYQIAGLNGDGQSGGEGRAAWD